MLTFEQKLDQDSKADTLSKQLLINKRSVSFSFVKLDRLNYSNNPKIASVSMSAWFGRSGSMVVAWDAVQQLPKVCGMSKIPNPLLTHPLIRRSSRWSKS